jgi:hypothetical protein
MKNNKIDIATIDKVYVGIDEGIQDSNLSSQIGTESGQYRCENCSSVDVIVIETWDFMQDQQEICSCNCGHCDDGVAAEREIIVQGLDWRSCGVDNYDSIEWDHSGIDVLEEEIIEQETFCPECFEESGWEDWCYEYGEIERDERSHKLVVFCRNCRHESEFPRSQYE